MSAAAGLSEMADEKDHGGTMKALVQEGFGSAEVLHLRQITRPELKELIEAGKLPPVIDPTYPLSEAREAVRYVGTGQARAKVVILNDMSGGR